MSYNITHWKTKKIKDFVIPLGRFRDLQRDGFNVDSQRHEMLGDREMLILDLCEDGGISGVVIDGDVRVMSIGIGGECSGRIYREELKETLEVSKGELEAAIIWEGGDSVTRLHVLDGVITEEPIEL